MNWPDFHRNGWKIELHGAPHGARIGTAAAVKVELGLKDIKIDYVPVTGRTGFPCCRPVHFPCQAIGSLGKAIGDVFDRLMEPKK